MRANAKLFLLSLAIFNGLVLFAFALGGIPLLAAENGILENLQALVIASAMALFLWTIPRRNAAARAVAVMLSFVCFSFFFREVDFRVLDVPTWVVDLTSGKIRDWIFLGLLSVVSTYLVLRTGGLRSVLRYVSSRLAAPLYLCAALLLVAAAIDKGLVTLMADPFWEEFAEINAYFALLVAALGFKRHAASYPLEQAQPTGA